MSEYIAPRSRARFSMPRFAIHWLAGILVSLLAVGGLSAPAFAAGGKVTVLPAESGRTYDGAPVLTEGGSYRFQLGYGSMSDGAVSTIDLPEGISIPDAALVVPTGNTAVKSLTIDAANRLVVTFNDPFPADVNQGVLDLTFTVETVTSSEVRELRWVVDGVTTTQRVIVTEAGDSPQSTGTWISKNASWVSIPHTVVDGKVVFDANVLNVEIPYTVTVSSTAARDVALTDTLGTGLAFVPGSLAGTKVVRDADDLNATTSTLAGLPAISGAVLEHRFAAEANSVYTFTYRATIADAAARDALRDRLQTAYNKVDRVEGGAYSVALTNSVDVNGETRSTSTVIDGRVSGQQRPDVAKAFQKSVDLRSVEVSPGLAAGAALPEGIPVTYTLGADLTAFAAFADGPFALTRNVVIRDTLSDQISWNTTGDFLVLTDQHGDEIALTRAVGLTGNEESAIAADRYVNTFAVSGRTVYINVGKDVTKKYSITAPATIETLPKWSTGDTPYRTEYRVDNNAFFVFAEGRYQPKGVSTTVVVPKDTSAGVDDPTKFSKSTPSSVTTVPSGTSTTIPYTFTVGRDVGDARSSRIVDAVNHSVFDVTEATLPQIKASISGMYEWNHPLDGDTFDVSLDEAGNLVIAPNAEFPKDAAWGASAAAPFTGTWTITVGIPTKVLQGKQTLDVTNHARYEGEGQEIVFTSTSKATATSFGNEMEVRKRLYDAVNGEWTGNLRVAVDAEGGLATDEFVYRVELIPHGTFASMVEDVVDVLPAGVEFVGFVAPGDVATGVTTSGDRQTIPGSSIIADYDAATKTVTVERGRLAAGSTTAVYFKVRVVEHAANVGITNVIGGAGATITPTNDYPLSLLKRDSTDASKLITDSAARFSVLAADGRTVVLGDLRVSDGRIITADGETPVVTEPGSYWLREDVAPVGYERTSDLSPITVGADGSSADVILFNTPRAAAVEPEKTYAIGDLVWIDANGDGAQTAGEQVLPGVRVELLRADAVIATTTTDAHGRYLFDELSAGEYNVRFTLTEEQRAIYRFTAARAGGDNAVDSDADAQTGITQTIVLGADNNRLTRDYGWADVRATEGIDPTWNAGVIVRATAKPEAEGPGADEPGSDEPGSDEPSTGDTTAPSVDGGTEQHVATGSAATPADPAFPGTPRVDELPATGGVAPLGILGIALFLLLSGTAVFCWRRRAA